MNRYIAFDVETPNWANDRMSAIGVVVLEDGEIIRRFEFNHFLYFFLFISCLDYLTIFSYTYTLYFHKFDLTRFEHIMFDLSISYYKKIILYFSTILPIKRFYNILNILIIFKVSIMKFLNSK